MTPIDCTTVVNSITLFPYSCHELVKGGSVKNLTATFSDPQVEVLTNELFVMEYEVLAFSCLRMEINIILFSAYCKLIFVSLFPLKFV